jgi:hypothetical protein
MPLDPSWQDRLRGAEREPEDLRQPENPSYQRPPPPPQPRPVKHPIGWYTGILCVIGLVGWFIIAISMWFWPATS